MKRVLVCDGVSPDGLASLERQFQIDHRPNLSREELLAIIPQYEGLIVRSATKADAELIAAGSRLEVIGRAGVGVDNIDINAASNRGIVVVNAPSGNTVAAAEHTLGMMLALARHIPQADASMKQRLWQKSKFLGVELYGKTLGIIGFGRIGAEVARRAQAFGMEILAHDPFAPAERAEAAGVRLVSLDELLGSADFLTLHTPKVGQVLGAAELARVKPGVRIVNCARGGLIDEAALLAALEDGRVAGAALDVFGKEPPADNPLLQLPNVVTTPHLGASTQEAQINVAEAVAEQVSLVLRKEHATTAVNLPPLPPEDLRATAPYLPLADLLGRFFAQAWPGSLSRVDIRYQGEIAGHPTQLLTNNLLKGLLDGVLDEPVNYINASMVAKRRGIKVEETQAHDDGPGSILSVTCYSGGKELGHVAGTLSSQGEMRLCNLEGHRVDIAPSRYMLFCHHIDRPGIIGRTGTILGENDINIAGMQVGRRRSGEAAVMLMQVDNPVPEDTTRAIAAVDGILAARFIRLTEFFPE